MSSFIGWENRLKHRRTINQKIVGKREGRGAGKSLVFHFYISNNNKKKKVFFYQKSFDRKRLKNDGRGSSEMQKMGETVEDDVPEKCEHKELTHISFP